MFPAEGTEKPDPKQEIVFPEHPGQSYEALYTEHSVSSLEAQPQVS